MRGNNANVINSKAQKLLGYHLLYILKIMTNRCIIVLYLCRKSISTEICEDIYMIWCF